jgi:hypothetical protein
MNRIKLLGWNLDIEMTVFSKDEEESHFYTTQGYDSHGCCMQCKFRLETKNKLHTALLA